MLAWEKDPKEWYKRYVLKEEYPTNRYMEYGKSIHEALGGQTTEDTDDYIKEVAHKMRVLYLHDMEAEKCFNINVNDIVKDAYRQNAVPLTGEPFTIFGYIDFYTKDHIVEVKTSTKQKIITERSTIDQLRLYRYAYPQTQKAIVLWFETKWDEGRGRLTGKYRAVDMTRKTDDYAVKVPQRIHSYVSQILNTNFENA